jgi:hypothetical protein
MSENRVLRKIFECMGELVTGGSIKLHNEELYNLYSSPTIITACSMRGREKMHTKF